MRSVAIACLMLLSVTACSVTDPGGAPKEHTVTGTVMVPAAMFAALYQSKQQSLLARIVGLVIPDSWAAVVGGKVGALNAFVPVPGVQLELVRMYYDPINNLYWDEPAVCEGPCPTTDAQGNFTLVTNETLTSNLALKATFIDPVSGTLDVVMRAMVYSTDVNVTPVSEATTQIVEASLSEFVGFDNFTIDEVGALVGLIEDMDIDLSGLDFTAAIDTIKTEASDVYNSYLLGFMAAGEVNVAKPNDIFHIMEYRGSVLAPNAVQLNGAAIYKSSLGGAVSFDSEGNFQSGSAMYHWGLRTEFTGNPVRLVDQALVELDQNPAGPNYAQYTTFGTPVGFRGIVAGNNGTAIAHSDTESTTAGFISNDGGLMAFLSEKDDTTVGAETYDRGIRILMRKWKSVTNSYNDQFTFDNNTVNLFDQSTDVNNNAQTSLDLNPLMDQSTYNVVLYQNYIYNDNTSTTQPPTMGNEVGVGTGQWSFDTTVQVTVADGENASAKPHGLVTVSNLNLNKLNAASFSYNLGQVIKNPSKDMEPCPNLFMIEEGGSLMLRRDSANAACNGIDLDIMAGAGAVSSDGEVFVVPQTFDDSEDNVLTEYIIPNPGIRGNTAGRRGYYIGLKQMNALNNQHIAGVYHVVGHITGLNGSSAKRSLGYTNVHGSLQFIPSLDDGLGNKLVTGTLYKKNVAMEQIFLGDSNPPQIITSTVVRQAVGGTYNAALDGTFSFTLPGTTETVTGAAGQLLTLNDGSQVAMLLAIPVVNNPSPVQSERGLLLLAHEFIVEYPIPPDPPGPPAPPPNKPPTPPS